MGALALVTNLTLTGKFTKSADLTEPIEAINITLPKDGRRYVNGTGANKANEIIIDTRTQSGVVSFDIDAFLDAFGDTSAFTELKEIHILNKSTTPGDVLKINGSALTDMFDVVPKVLLGPGGLFTLTSPIDGFGISSPSQNSLTVDAGLAVITYDLILVGEV